MKIFTGYQTVDKPWGGANNFLRRLYAALQENYNVKIATEPSNDCDLFFFGQIGKGPAQGSGVYSFEEIKAVSAFNPHAPMIMRMVNTRKNSAYKYTFMYWFNARDRALDKSSIDAANFCDGIVFQSKYQKDFLTKQGVRARNSRTIINAAPIEFCDKGGYPPLLNGGHNLKLFSSAFSTKAFKNYGVISDLSLIPGVEVHHAGAWPDYMLKQNVNLLGVLDQNDILEQTHKHHYYLHPAFSEVCSNSIVECMAAGLPVLYGDKPSGSAEIVGDCGLMLDESDLEKSVQIARDVQNELVFKLKAVRHHYSIERAAAEYYEFFLEMIEKKKVGGGNIRAAV